MLEFAGDISNCAAPLAVVPMLVPMMPVIIGVMSGVAVAIGAAIVALFRPGTMKALGRALWSQKFPVLLVLTVVFAAFWWGPRLFTRTAAVAAAQGGTDWPLWRGNFARRGASLDADDPTRGSARWSFTDGKINTFMSSPAVVGNRIYVAGARYEVFTDSGPLYCLDADTGKVVWKHEAGYRATFSSPAVWGNYLAVGEGLHFTTDSRIRCLDVAASEKKREGVLLWDFRTKSNVESSPCIGEGKVIVGAAEDGMYCFAVEGDGKGGAKVLWHLPGDQWPDCEASPTIYEGKVYSGLGRVVHAIFCVDAATGKELWRIPTPYPVFGPPAIADGKMYIGMGTGNYIQTADEVAAQTRAEMTKAGKPASEIEAAVKALAPIGEVWCVDIKTHDVQWKYTVGQIVLGAVAVADGKAYFGSRDGFVYAVTTDGKPAGKWNSHAPIVTCPAVGKAHVYVVTTKGQMFALDRETLAPAWEIDLGAESMSSPAVARGHVYVGTSGEGLVCAGEPGVAKAETWDGYLGGPGKSGWDGSPVSARGQFAWRWPAANADGSEPKVPLILAPAAHVKGTLYVETIFGDNIACLTHLKLADDGVSAPTEIACGPNEFKVEGSPSPTIRMADIEFEWTEFGLIAMDRPTGKCLWQTRARIRTGPILAGGRIWFGSGYGLETCEIDNGTLKGRVGFPAPASALVTDGKHLACANETGKILIVDVEQNTEVAKIDGAPPMQTGNLMLCFPPMLAGNIVLYFSPTGIMRYDIETKKSAVWFTFPEWMGRPTTPMIMVKSNVYFGTDKMGFVCVKARR